MGRESELMVKKGRIANGVEDGEWGERHNK